MGLGVGVLIAGAVVTRTDIGGTGVVGVLCRVGGVSALPSSGVGSIVSAGVTVTSESAIIVSVTVTGVSVGNVVLVITFKASTVASVT